MRKAFAGALASLGARTAWPAVAVTLFNLNQDSGQVCVCDNNCGPSFGEGWGSAQDFWLESDELRRFDCSGQCIVRLFYDGHSPTLGDTAIAEDDERFQSSETG